MKFSIDQICSFLTEKILNGKLHFFVQCPLGSSFWIQMCMSIFLHVSWIWLASWFLHIFELIFNPFLPDFSVEFCAVTFVKFGWMVSLWAKGKRGVWGLMRSSGLNRLLVLNFLCKDYSFSFYYLCCVLRR